MGRKVYGSDVSREQFERVRPLLEGVRKPTKPRTVDWYEGFLRGVVFAQDRVPVAHAAGRISEVADGAFVLQQVVRAWSGRHKRSGAGLKKIGWRGPRQTGAELLAQLLDRRRAEREEHRYGEREGL